MSGSDHKFIKISAAKPKKRGGRDELVWLYRTGKAQKSLGKGCNCHKYVYFPLGDSELLRGRRSSAGAYLALG